MTNLRTVKIPILERVVLEDLASRWDVTTDQALTRLIRQAAKREVLAEENAPAVQMQAQGATL